LQKSPRHLDSSFFFTATVFATDIVSSFRHGEVLHCQTGYGCHRMTTKFISMNC